MIEIKMPGRGRIVMSEPHDGWQELTVRLYNLSKGEACEMSGLEELTPGVYRLWMRHGQTEEPVTVELRET